jgi:hypothetical protein
MFLHPGLLFPEEMSGMTKGVFSAILLFFVFLCLIQGICNAAEASSSGGKPFVFPEIIGWKQSGEIQTFIPKTLYEYINGAADLYLAYDFQELKVAEYLNDKKASVTLEIYRHHSPTDAFGIYSQERLPDANYLNIGAQGYIDKNILNLLLGNYYIKINSYNTGAEDQEVLQAFAKKVVEKLSEGGGLPSILSSFPVDGKIKNSEKFIARNFLGYSFLKSAFTADYDLSGQKFKLFLLDCGDKDECRNIVQKYLQQTKNSDKELAEERYTLSDPHHGVVDISWKGKYIWGVFDLRDPDLRSKYLKLFEEGLEKK